MAKRKRPSSAPTSPLKAPNIHAHSVAIEGGLCRLPSALLQSILLRLDVASICSAAASCRLLNSAASQALQFLPSFDMEDFLPDNKLLEQLLFSNASLRSLDLDCRHLDDYCIPFLLKPSLRELHLEECGQISESLLVEIGRSCQSLRSLSLTLDLVWRCSSPSISALGLVHLLKECSSLELLSLQFLSQIFEGGELALIPQVVAPSLKELKLGSLIDEDVIHIISNNGNGGAFQNLQRLSLTFLNLISDSLMTVISKRLPFILELELTDDYDPEDEIPEDDDDLSNRGMRKIGNCKKLQRLSIVRLTHRRHSFVRVNDDGFLSMIKRCPCLSWITLGGFSHITDMSFSAILYHCRALKTLKLVDADQVTDLAFVNLAAMPFLSSVSLSWALISDYSIRCLAYCCRGLETLNLNSCRNIGDCSLNVISDLVKLKTLVLNGSDVSDFGLVTLGKGKTPLRSISLRGCRRITDNGIAALLEGDIAKTLSSLDLSSIPQLTDNTILTLVQSGLHLVKLRLRDCPLIGDASIIALASMHLWNKCYGGTLKLLDLWKCKGITKISIAWFKKPYFPRLRWVGFGETSIDFPEAFKDRPMLRLERCGFELDDFRYYFPSKVED